MESPPSSPHSNAPVELFNVDNTRTRRLARTTGETIGGRISHE